MCFSAPVSLATYLLGSSFSYLLYLENEVSYKIIGIFMGYVVLMQLIEFLLWSHQKCDLYNKSVSFAGMIINYFQPIVLGLLLLYFYNQSKTNTQLNKNIIKSLILFYLVCVILYLVQFAFQKNKCTIKDNSPYLLWKWGQMNFTIIINVIYVIILFLLLYLGIPDKKAAISIIILAAITLSISFIYYPRPFLGAIWCFFSAFIPLGLYLIKKFIIDKIPK